MASRMDSVGMVTVSLRRSMRVIVNLLRVKRIVQRGREST
jgi:hypothetical protein